VLPPVNVRAAHASHHSDLTERQLATGLPGVLDAHETGCASSSWGRVGGSHLRLPDVPSRRNSVAEVEPINRMGRLSWRSANFNWLTEPKGAIAAVLRVRL
jgi:hypothetical protein